MTDKTLARALHDIRLHLRDVSDASPSDRQLRDASDLLGVLIHVVEGMSVRRAFGAPGDWGYGTPIGEGVRQLHQQLAS